MSLEQLFQEDGELYKGIECLMPRFELHQHVNVTLCILLLAGEGAENAKSFYAEVSDVVLIFLEE
jgi:hypothetical protein